MSGGNEKGGGDEGITLVSDLHLPIIERIVPGNQRADGFISSEWLILRSGSAGTELTSSREEIYFTLVSRNTEFVNVEETTFS